MSSLPCGESWMLMQYGMLQQSQLLISGGASSKMMQSSGQSWLRVRKKLQKRRSQEKCSNLWFSHICALYSLSTTICQFPFFPGGHLPFTLYCPQSSSLFFCRDFLTAVCTFLVLLSSYFLCYAGCFSYFQLLQICQHLSFLAYSKLPCDVFSSCILLYFLVCVSSLSDSIDWYPSYLCAASSLSFCLPLFLWFPYASGFPFIHSQKEWR